MTFTNAHSDIVHLENACSLVNIPIIIEWCFSKQYNEILGWIYFQLMEPIQVIASFHIITLHPAEPKLKNPNRLEEI